MSNASAGKSTLGGAFKKKGPPPGVQVKNVITRTSTKFQGSPDIIRDETVDKNMNTDGNKGVESLDDFE